MSDMHDVFGAEARIGIQHQIQLLVEIEGTYRNEESQGILDAEEYHSGAYRMVSPTNGPDGLDGGTETIFEEWIYRCQ